MCGSLLPMGEVTPEYRGDLQPTVKPVSDTNSSFYLSLSGKVLIQGQMTTQLHY